MKTFHYGWVIVGVGVLVKMAGLGFGRFAYPMLIPGMRESLGFNYSRDGTPEWSHHAGLPPVLFDRWRIGNTIRSEKDCDRFSSLWVTLHVLLSADCQDSFLFFSLPLPWEQGVQVLTFP